jgi:DNA-binding transcriptional LysR family regulator
MGDSSRQPGISTGEAMRRLGSVRFGRIFFTRHALPAVCPVSHLLDGGRIIIRCHDGSAIVTAAQAGRGAVVVYEADEIDPVSRAGWYVSVIGLARLVSEPQAVHRYRTALRPWAAVGMDDIIGIEPKIVTGFELR